MKRKIHVVPHSHWDREWYFTTSRSKVYLMKDLGDVLDTLERPVGYFRRKHCKKYVLRNEALRKLWKIHECRLCAGFFWTVRKHAADLQGIWH